MEFHEECELAAREQERTLRWAGVPVKDVPMSPERRKAFSEAAEQWRREDMAEAQRREDAES